VELIVAQLRKVDRIRIAKANIYLGLMDWPNAAECLW
jgi:hypothetical protein